MAAPRTMRTALCSLVLVAVAGCSGPADEPEAPTSQPGLSGPEQPTDPQRPVPEYTRAPGVVTDADVPVSGDPLARWQAETAVEDVRITSTADGAQQPALWAPPDEQGQPLLVLVHSWSTGYEQEINIPVAQWADQVDWGYVQPDFRGVNDDPAATGSALAVQDVLDAVDFAVTEGGVDPERVYVSGFSGGGMMSLLLAGQHPDRFAGAVSWVPIHDLEAWYAYNRDQQPEAAYADQISASCGGDPTADPAAGASCAQRSPAGVLDAARQAEVPVYIGAGLGDETVPPSEALRSFNALADEADRLPEDVVESVGRGELPGSLQGMVTAETWFAPADPEVLFARASGEATVVVFDGGHEFVYYPGLEWMARLDASR